MEKHWIIDDASNEFNHPGGDYASKAEAEAECKSLNSIGNNS